MPNKLAEKIARQINSTIVIASSVSKRCGNHLRFAIRGIVDAAISRKSGDHRQ